MYLIPMKKQLSVPENIPPSPLNYNHLSHLLKDLSTYLQLLGPNYSYKNLCSKFGYKSPRSLGMIFSGQRQANVVFIEVLAEVLNYSKKETEILMLLLAQEKAHKSKKPIELISKQIQALRTAPVSYSKVPMEVFPLISQWPHSALLSWLTEVEDTSAFWSELAKKFNHVTADELQSCFYRLVRLGYFKPKYPDQKDINNTFILSKNPFFKIGNNTPSKSIQSFHKQILHLAQLAIEEQSPLRRELNALTLKFSSDQIKNAKQKILQFVEEFESEFHSEDGDEVMQLNIQLFSLFK